MINECDRLLLTLVCCYYYYEVCFSTRKGEAISREKVSSARGTSQSKQSSMKQMHTLSALTSTPDKGGAEWELESESALLLPDVLSAFSSSHVAA